MSKPYIIAIDGISGSGKSTLAKHIVETLAKLGVKAAIINGDRFYRNAREDEDPHTRNYDVPEAFDQKLRHETMLKVCQREKVELPIYNYEIHARDPEKVDILDTNEYDVILWEGILECYWEVTRILIDLLIFVDVPKDECLGRRILRDMQERGRSVDNVLKQWNATVSPSITKYIEPLKQVVAQSGGIVVPKGGNNEQGRKNVIGRIAVDLQLDLSKLQKKE